MRIHVCVCVYIYMLALLNYWHVRLSCKKKLYKNQDMLHALGTGGGLREKKMSSWDISWKMHQLEVYLRAEDFQRVRVCVYVCECVCVRVCV
jgi:hypothetical protein